jgi:hypothetical protein
LWKLGEKKTNKNKFMKLKGGYSGGEREKGEEKEGEGNEKQ